MGRFEPSWATDVTAKLVALPADNGYGFFRDRGGLGNLVNIVPIRYDDVFSRYADGWGRSAAELEQASSKLGIGIPRIFGWLQNASETEKNFFWTHVLDVLLYRFFPIVTAEVRLRLQHQIAEVLLRAQQDGELAEVSVLAHSLGTAVAHDALALLGSRPIDTDVGPNHAWMADNFKFSNIFMCANVSRALETDQKVYDSVVHPTTGGAGPAYTEAYYNFHHCLDPFPLVRPFAPTGWGENYISTEECRKILEFDVHALTVCLEDPRVHVPLLRGMFGLFSVTDAEFDAAKQRYDALPGPPCLEVLNAFKVQAETLVRLAHERGDVEALIIEGTKFFSAAKTAVSACG